jgi:signal transduction histidine kinase
LCRADLKQNTIVPRLNLAKTLPVVYVDSVQIEQVLLNLIRNSLDALKNLPEKSQRLLSIQTGLDAHNDIVVRVKDNGPGINEAEQEKILTPFFTTKKSGMGMGLSISQSIIKAHGGVLSFNSKPGKGTTFYFTLPVKEE